MKERYLITLLPSSADRASFTPREEVPIPTNPPFNAFVGNLSFDVDESHLESYFEHGDGVSQDSVGSTNY